MIMRWSGIESCKFLIELSRLKVILGLLSQFWCGAALSSYFDFKLLLLGTASYACGVVSTIVVNQIGDVDIDEKSKPYLPLPKNRDKIKVAQIYALILSVLSLIFAFFINQIFIALVLFSIVLSLAYSIPPVRFKNRFLLDIVSNGAVVVITFSLGYACFTPVLVSRFTLFFLAFALLCLPGFLTDSLFDYPLVSRNYLPGTIRILGFKRVIITGIISTPIITLFLILQIAQLGVNPLMPLIFGIFPGVVELLPYLRFIHSGPVPEHKLSHEFTEKLTYDNYWIVVFFYFILFIIFFKVFTANR
jgi:4-hydroxybenzoate polyprenyltransferase